MPSLRSTHRRDTGAIFFCISSPNNRQSDPIKREILNSVKVERRNFVMSLPNNNSSPPRSNPDNLPRTRQFEIQLGTVQIGCVYIEMANLPRHIWSRGWPSHPVRCIKENICPSSSSIICPLFVTTSIHPSQPGPCCHAKSRTLWEYLSPLFSSLSSFRFLVLPLSPLSPLYEPSHRLLSTPACKSSLRNLPTPKTMTARLHISPLLPGRPNKSL